jgi:hypothetical protein
VITHFGGTRFTYPLLSNKTDHRFPVMWIELHRDGNLIASGVAQKSFLIRHRAHKIFTEIAEGDYLIKVFWKLDNSTIFFNGAKTVTIDGNKKVNVLCLWERIIKLTFSDQYGKGIEGIRTILLNKEDFLFDENTTDVDGEVVLKAPFTLGDSYSLKAFYRDFVVYDGNLKKSLIKLRVNVDIELYDLTVEVKDVFNLPPGVEITPILSDNGANSDVKLIPEEIEQGKFLFEDIPSGGYKLQISYANFIDEKALDLPYDNDLVIFKFSAEFNLVVDLFDLRANPLLENDINFEILRNGKKVFETNENIFSLPPASYTIKAYDGGDLVGIKEVELTNNRNIKLVTTLISILPTLIIGFAFVFIVIVIVLTFKGILSLNYLLKFLAIAFIVIALTLPWWELSGSSINSMIERNTQMFMNPQVMMEVTSYDGRTIFDIAEMPEIFVDFLGKVVFVAYAVCLLLGFSFISNKLGKKQYSLLLNLLSIILLITIISMFYVGTSKVCEASIGNVMGEGFLNISLEETVPLKASWGFASGFYLIISSMILAMVSLFLEFKNYFTNKKK